MGNDVKDSRAAVATVRPIKDYTFEPGELTGLKPLDGFAGCLALVPTGAGELEVAIFVAAAVRNGVAWLPPMGTLIMDVPPGFPIDDGAAILGVLKQSGPDGKPGPPGSVKS